MRKLARWFGVGSADRTVLPDGPLDLLAPRIVADPYPTYAALRRDRPLAELASGGFLLTRHADVTAAFTEPALGNAPSRFSVLAPRNRDRHTAAALAAHIPPFLDMPDHRLPRQAVSRAFHETMRDFAPRLPEIARETVEGLGAGRRDLVADCSGPFALRVMSEFTGITAEPSELKALTRAFFHLFAPVTDAAAFAETNSRLDAARALIARALEARRAAPGATLLGALLRFQSDHPELSDAQILDNALLVFADGVENIEAGAATALWHLHRAPDVLPDPEDTAAVERALREVLRLDTPGQIIPRVAREALVLHGREIAPGTPVFLALGSANRDPEAHADPDRLIPDRSGDAVTFGRGRHRCIGEPLGVAQLTALVQALLLRGARPYDPKRAMDYVPRFGHRWPSGLSTVLP